MGAYIKALSYYLPERVVTNEDLVREFPEWDVQKVYDKVGVKERHLAGEAETSGDLAEKAARKLFEEYNVSPSDIDFLLLCTQSPDYRLPSTLKTVPFAFAFALFELRLRATPLFPNATVYAFVK